MDRQPTARAAQYALADAGPLVPPPFTTPTPSITQAPSPTSRPATASPLPSAPPLTGASSPTPPAPGTSSPSSGDKDGDDGTTAKGFVGALKERVAELNEASTAATKELDAVAPPPLRDTLQAAVKKVTETDYSPLATSLQRVMGDLKEGFQGLGEGAVEFDAAAATQQFKAMVETELAARKVDTGVPTVSSAPAVPGEKGSGPVGETAAPPGGSEAGGGP